VEEEEEECKTYVPEASEDRTMGIARPPGPVSSGMQQIPRMPAAIQEAHGYPMTDTQFRGLPESYQTRRDCSLEQSAQPSRVPAGTSWSPQPSQDGFYVAQPAKQDSANLVESGMNSGMPAMSGRTIGFAGIPISNIPCTRLWAPEESNRLPVHPERHQSRASVTGSRPEHQTRPAQAFGCRQAYSDERLMMATCTSTDSVPDHVLFATQDSLPDFSRTRGPAFQATQDSLPNSGESQNSTINTLGSLPDFSTKGSLPDISRREFEGQPCTLESRLLKGQILELQPWQTQMSVNGYRMNL